LNHCVSLFVGEPMPGTFPPKVMYQKISSDQTLFQIRDERGQFTRCRRVRFEAGDEAPQRFSKAAGVMLVNFSLPFALCFRTRATGKQLKGAQRVGSAMLKNRRK